MAVVQADKRLVLCTPFLFELKYMHIILIFTQYLQYLCTYMKVVNFMCEITHWITLWIVWIHMCKSRVNLRGEHFTFNFTLTPMWRNVGHPYHYYAVCRALLYYPLGSPFGYSWIAHELQVGTSLGRRHNLVRFQIWAQFWIPQPKLHGAVYLIFL